MKQMKQKKLLGICLSLAVLILSLNRLEVSAWVSDNGNDTYTNPIMWGDYPDNDIIRVGDTYYMSSTSMHLFPGCPIMSSKDLVNWTYESYAVERMEGDMYNLKNANAYDEGPWATSLRYHDGKFYLLFNINRDAAFVSIADSAKGPWKMYKLEDELYDPGLIFDDDQDKVYVVHGQGDLYLSELKIVNKETGELSIISKREPGAGRNGKKIYSYTGGAYNEGSHVYKFGEYYYILSTPTWSAGSKKEIAIRTKDLANGPYEVKDIMTSFMNFERNGIHQGGIVDVPQGEGKEPEWWSVIFQDRGKLGRVPTLQPVYWEDGWPMIGEKGLEGQKAVTTHRKPNIIGLDEEIKPAPPLDSDDFSTDNLGLQWQWNHNPNNEFWSLTERPGYMRLKTATVTGNLSYAQNTLTQRIIGPDCTGTVKMDVSGMTDGDMAGLAVMQRDYNYIGVSSDGGDKSIVLCDGAVLQTSIDLPGDVEDIWFRADMPRHEYRIEYSYSFDGMNFTQLGGRYDMRYGTYVGERFGIFHYANKKLGGYIDVDFFELTSSEDDGNLFGVNEKIDAERYDNQYFVLDKDLSQNLNMKTSATNDDVNGGFDLCVENLKDGDWLEFDRIDFGKGDAKWFNARIASAGTGNKLEVHQNTKDGPLLATLEIPNTGNADTYVNAYGNLGLVPKNIQKIVLVFKGAKSNLCKVNWFMFGTGSYPAVPEIPAGVTASCSSDSIVDISWEDAAGALEYDLMFDNKVISNAHSGFSMTGVRSGSTHTVKVRAKNLGGYSEWSQEVQVKTPANEELIPYWEMTAKASSEETDNEDNGAARAIDGDTTTFWHTRWSDNNMPYQLDLDLGNVYDVCKMDYVPRPGGGNGSVSLYNIYTSLDGKNYTLIKEHGVWMDDGQEKTVEFPLSTAKFLRFEVLRGRNAFGCAAEIRVYHGTKPLAIKMKSKKLTASSGDAKAAVDGSADTLWEAEEGDEQRYVEVDLGTEYDLTRVELEWPQEASSQYTVEASPDGKIWNQVVDRTGNPTSELLKADELTARQMRYVRIIFAEGGEASIGELRLLGCKNPYSEGENVILNKAVQTDSETKSNPGVFGNDGADGVEKTMWKVADNQNPHYWQVALGGKYNLTGSKLTFENGEKAMKYKIEVSGNGKDWSMAADKMENTEALPKEMEDVWTAKGVSYVRVTMQSIPGADAGFRNFEVYGALATEANMRAYGELSMEEPAEANKDFGMQFATLNAEGLASWKVTIGYDENLFQLKEAAPASSVIKIISEDYSIPGKVTYELACQEGKTWTGRASVLDLTFHVKKTGLAVFTASDIEISKSEEEPIPLADVRKTIEGKVDIEPDTKFKLLPESGFYRDQQKVTVDTSNSQLEFHYTLDGSEPTAESAVYNEGIRLPYGITRLKVAAFLQGEKAGETKQAEYMLNHSANLALHKTASSEQDAKWSDFPLEASVDGDTDTWWTGDPALSEWTYEIDFGETVTFNALHLVEYARVQQEYRITGYTMEYYDGGDWQELDQYDAANPGKSKIQLRNDPQNNPKESTEMGSVFQEVTGSKVRFHFTANAQISIREVEVYYNDDQQNPADTTGLSEEVRLAKELDPANYTDPSKFLEALQKAEELLAQGGLTEKDQPEIDAAADALKKAREDLVPKPAALTELFSAIWDAEAIDLNLYLEKNAEAFRQALSEASVLASRDDLTIFHQKTVDQAAQKLRSAMAGLVKKADRAELDQQISKAEEIDLGKYTQDSAAELRKALNEAKTLAAREDLAEADQPEINQAVQNLKNAISSLKEEISAPVLQLKALQDAIRGAQAIVDRIGDYTFDTVKDLPGILEEAKVLIARESKTQKEVDDMTLRLATAVSRARRITNAPDNGDTKPVKAKKVSLNKKSLTLRPKSSFNLKADIKPFNAENKKVTFKSSNPKTVKVTKSGKVTALKKGKATITVTTKDGGKKAYCKVTVKKKLPKPKFTKESVKVKRKHKLSVRKYLKVYDSSEEKVTWSSKNKKVAAVDKNGVVTGKKKGTAIIVAKNKAVTLKIKVVVK